MNVNAPDGNQETGSRWRYLLWGVLLWLAVSAIILLAGASSKFIYIDF